MSPESPQRSLSQRLHREAQARRPGVPVFDRHQLPVLTHVSGTDLDLGDGVVGAALRELMVKGVGSTGT